MGTRWRGLLAPIDKPTGDGRRMKTGAFTHRELPLALKWQRVDDAGHDASVVVGLVDKLTIDDKAGEVWGEGELFDDQPDLPRLTEDVAEAKLMLSKKVIGPSVDAGAAEVVFVETGTDEPLTDERWEELMVEGEKNGEEPKIEMLFTRYEIAAATLVVIPAFAEARPFELLTPVEDQEKVPVAASLVASLTASAGTAVPPADVFDRLPADGERHRIQVEDRGEGFLRVFGYAAQFGTCHVGFKDVCRTPPQSEAGYVPFHRYAVDVDNGWVAAGRLTHGFGRTGCDCGACDRNDDHACGAFTLAQAIAHHDRMATIAYVRATDTPDGCWVAGYAPANLEPAARAALGRQKWSGDWREHGGHLELVEVLALAREREGFPITPSVGMHNGRQLSLTAAGVVRAERPSSDAPLDVKQLARDVAGLVLAELRPATTEAAATEPAGLPVPDENQADNEPVENPAADEAAALIAEVELTVANADPEAIVRAEQASELLGDLEELEPAGV